MPITNLVKPRIYTAKDLVDVPSVADGTTQAFEKYNVHEHARSVVPDFRAYPLKLGDPVYIYDEIGNEVFAGTQPPVIDYITGTKLRLNLSATKTLVGATMYYKAPRANSNTLILLGVDVVENSQYLTFSQPLQTEDFQLQEGLGIPGFISQKQLASLVGYSQNYNLAFNTWSNFVYLDVNIQHASWLLDLTYLSTSVTTSAQLKYYDPNNNLHEAIDPITWSSYGPTFSIVADSRDNLNFIPQIEPVFFLTYPLSRPSKPLPAGGMLGLSLTSVPAAEQKISLALHFNKILN